MERAAWLVALVLLPTVPPVAAAEDSYGLCVDPYTPNVAYGRCGPRVPTVGVHVTLITPLGADTYGVGCQRDCDYEVNLCAFVAVRPPVEGEWRTPADGPAENASRMLDHWRMPSVIAMDSNIEPSQPCIDVMP